MAETVGNTKTFRLFNESVLAVTNHLDAVIPTGVFHTGVDTEIFIMAGFCLFNVSSMKTESYYTVILRSDSDEESSQDSSLRSE